MSTDLERELSERLLEGTGRPLPAFDDVEEFQDWLFWLKDEHPAFFEEVLEQIEELMILLGCS